MIQVESTSKSNTMVVRVTGRLDASASNEFEEACAHAVASETQILILDLSQLRYVSSAGLRVVLTAAKSVQGKGGMLQVVGLGGMVREVFEISGFLGLFPQFESVDAAMAAAWTALHGGSITS